MTRRPTTRRGFLRTGLATGGAAAGVTLAGCASRSGDDRAFVLSFFRTGVEAMHLATSTDGYAWETLNGGDPVLRGSVRTETLRDPFLFEDREGTFHLLSTDGWESQYVVHATSSDLVEWSDQEAFPVMTGVEGAKNAWAPECYYDRENDEYRLLWSSTVETDPGEEYNNRIWSATTDDFETVGPAEWFVDPGFEVIDATVVHHDGAYHMALKDERGVNELDTDYKAVRTATAADGEGPFDDLSDLVTPSPVEGPTLFRNEGEWWLFYDYFLEDRYGASRSEDFETWETFGDEVDFPAKPRHASVLAVDADVVEGLRDAWG
ncbi:MAG: glycoside hydrolase family 43 protein [Haloarculaceae archaeon]